MIRCDLIGLSRGAAQLVLHFSVSINIQVDKNRSDNATLGSFYHANLPILQMAKSKFSLQRVCVCFVCVCVCVCVCVSGPHIKLFIAYEVYYCSKVWVQIFLERNLYFYLFNKDTLN